MSPKLYKTDLSPAVRAVYLTVEALNIRLDYIETNFVANDTLKPEFTNVRISIIFISM